MNVLIDFLTSLALGLVAWWVDREDVKKLERQRFVFEQLKLESAALLWLAEARTDPARWSVLCVLPGFERLLNFHVNAASTSNPIVGNLPPTDGPGN